MSRTAIDVAVIGAGPVGLALALLAAQTLPHATVTVFDARDPAQDVGADPRTLALSLGSVQLLERLRAFPAAAAQPIASVHVSQAAPTLEGAEVWLHAQELRAPMLGAVVSYGALVAALQRTWEGEMQRDGGRLRLRLGTTVTALKEVASGVEVDAGIAERFDLVVVAEGGVFGEQAPRALMRDYGQTAWVGAVTLDGAPRGVAFERFTAAGPVALLPLAGGDAPISRAALVWCVDATDDPVRDRDDAMRLALLAARLPRQAGRLVAIGPLKSFALGLNAQRTLVDGRVVRIGNAAQTLHPVAGQGLNLGLRDAYPLAQSLRRADGVERALAQTEWARAADRWSVIASTDFLARSFTWQAPGMAAARGLALAALQRSAVAKGWLARQMMFGRR